MKIMYPFYTFDYDYDSLTEFEFLNNIRNDRAMTEYVFLNKERFDPLNATDHWYQKCQSGSFLNLP